MGIRDLAKGKYWTKTVNVFTGCTPYRDPLNPCLHCWARQMVRLRPHVDGGHGFKPAFHEARLLDLARKQWRNPQVVFANICGDWCHEQFKRGERRAALMAMANHRDSIFLSCTKRTGALSGMAGDECWAPNVWPGVTFWDRFSLWRALESIAAHGIPGWLSGEPLLDDLPEWPGPALLDLIAKHVRWIAVGPETGSGRRRCPPRRIRDGITLAHRAGIPCWVKAVDLGSRVSHDPSEWPEDLRVRELPPELERILKP